MTLITAGASLYMLKLAEWEIVYDGNIHKVLGFWVFVGALLL